MTDDPRRTVRTAYWVAVAATAVAAGLRSALDPWLALSAPLLPFLAAVIVSAWYGGLGPGLTAAALGAVGGGLFFLWRDPAVPLDPPSIPVRLAIFLGVCALVSAFFEALHRSRRLLTTTLESITDAFARLDRGWRYRYVNAEQERMAGRPRADLLGRSVWEAWPDLLGTNLESEFRRAVADRVAVEFEYRHAPWDRWFAVKAFPMPDGGLTVCTRDITVAKRDAEARRTSEQRFRDLADAMPQIVYVAGPDGGIEFVNRRWSEHTGQGGAETADLPGVVHPDDIGGLLERWRVAMTAGTTLDAEFRILGRDGGYRWFLTRAVAVPAAAGVRWYGTSTDIHDQKRTQDELARMASASELQRRLFDTALSHTADFVYSFDLEGRFTYANAALLRLWGKELHEAVGRTFFELDYPTELAARLQRQIRDVIDARRPVRDETPYANSEGERMYEYILVPVIGAGGAVEAVAGSTRDITDRKTAEVEIARLNAALADRVHELQAILDAAPVGINVAADAQCRDIRGNRALAELVGMTEGDNVSRSRPDADRLPYRVLRDGVEVAAEDLPMQRAARFGVRVDAEMYDFERADGTVVTAMVTAVPVRGLDGAVTGAVGVCTDVTALRKAEQALRDADRRKDEFLATLAHELRNPLAPVRSGLEVLRTEGIDPAVAGHTLAMMDRQLGHLVVLIDDLLDVSRITQGKLTLRREPVSLSDAIEHAVEAASPLVERHGHHLTVEVPSDPIPLRGDLTRLAQVVGNLLTNSAKYTPPGGRIRLTATRDGDEAVIRVTDTGIGIPPAAVPRLFLLFSQVDRALEKTTGGLGIGLALVKGLVEMHGGTVTAHSDGEGEGSTFTVRLPCAVVESESESEDAPAAVVPHTPKAAGKRRVLVVDDNRDAADSLAVLLTLGGHEARSAYDGLHAVAAAGGFRPHLILMDVGMPKLNGLDATRRIREQPWGADICIVALTGWGQDADKDRTAEAGCDGHLVKPVSPGAVADLLARLPATA